MDYSKVDRRLCYLINQLYSRNQRISVILTTNHELMGDEVAQIKQKRGKILYKIPTVNQYVVEISARYIDWLSLQPFTFWIQA